VDHATFFEERLRFANGKLACTPDGSKPIFHVGFLRCSYKQNLRALDVLRRFNYFDYKISAVNFPFFGNLLKFNSAASVARNCYDKWRRGITERIGWPLNEFSEVINEGRLQLMLLQTRVGAG